MLVVDLGLVLFSVFRARPLCGETGLAALRCLVNVQSVVLAAVKSEVSGLFETELKFVHIGLRCECSLDCQIGSVFLGVKQESCEVVGNFCGVVDFYFTDCFLSGFCLLACCKGWYPVLASLVLDIPVG